MNTKRARLEEERKYKAMLEILEDGDEEEEDMGYFDEMDFTDDGSGIIDNCEEDSIGKDLEEFLNLIPEEKKISTTLSGDSYGCMKVKVFNLIEMTSHKLGFPTAFQISPDGKFVIGTSNSLIIVVSSRSSENLEIISTLSTPKGVKGTLDSRSSIFPEQKQSNEGDMFKVEKVLGRFSSNSIHCLRVHDNLIAVGYSDGSVSLWEMDTGKLKKMIPDVFENAVEQLSFLDSNLKLICSDIKGNVSIITFWKNIFKFSYEIISVVKDGDHPITQICSLPLPSNTSTILKNNYPLFQMCIVALATRNKITITNIKENPIVLENIPIQNSPDILPFISWRAPSITEDIDDQSQLDTRIIHPALAVSSGNRINIYMMNSDGSMRMKRSLDIKEEVIGMGWLAERVLLAFDIKGNLIVIDPDTERYEVEANISPIYPSYAKFLINIGEEIEGEGYSGYKNYANFFGMKQDQFYMLNSEFKVARVSVESWKERINEELRFSWDNALKLSLEFFEGKARAPLGISNDPKTREYIVSNFIGSLLLSYLDYSIAPRGLDITRHYISLGKKCIDYCVRIKKLGLLFSSVMERFEANQQRDLFLDLLEEPMKKGELQSIPEDIFDLFVKRCILLGKLVTLEECILHLDVSKMEFLKIEQICTQNELFKALLYINMVAKGDYIEILKDLIEVMREESHTKTDVYQRLGEVVLEHVDHILKGDVSSKDRDQLPLIKQSIVDMLFDTDPHQSPIFMIMINFEPKKFFDMLSLTMKDESPSTPWNNTLRGAVVKMLIENLVDSKKPAFEIVEDEYIHQRLSFFFFLAKLIAEGTFRALIENDDIVDRIVSHMCYAIRSMERQEEKENILISMLDCFKNIDANRLNRFIVASNRVHRVKMYLFKRQGHVDVYVNSLLNELNLENEETFPNFLQQVFSGEDDVMRRVFDWLAKKIPSHKKKESFRKLSYQIITRVINHFKYIHDHSESSNSSLTTTEALKRNGFIVNEHFHYYFLDLLNQYNKDQVVSYLKEQEDQNLDIDVCSKICDDNPEAKSFLLLRTGEIAKSIKEIGKELEKRFVHLRDKLNDFALSIDKEKEGDDSLSNFEQELVKNSHKYKIDDEPLIILPNIPVKKQIQKHIEKQKSMMELPQINEQCKDVLDMQESKELLKELQIAIRMCIDNSKRETLDDQEVEDLWFFLLNLYIQFLRKLRYGLRGEIPPVCTSRHPSSLHSPTKSQESKKEDSETDSSDESDGGRDLDDLKEEFKDTKQDIEDLEKELSASDDPEKIKRRIEHKKKELERVKLLMKKALLEQNMKKEQEHKMEKDSFQTIHKLANMWLQRCILRFLREILKEIVRYVPIPTIIERIVEDHKADQFANIKPMILRISANYIHERMLLRTANELLSEDAFELGRKLHIRSLRGIKPKDYRLCSACHQNLRRRGSRSNVFLFYCGHTLHTECLGKSRVCSICFPS